MAIGIAALFGYRFPRNFNQPYRAASMQDFWRRWHISLSTWLRDYLYLSLGGNRGGAWKTQRNLFLTMTIGGLWHGASWHFVVWGMYQGALLIVHRLLQPLLGRVKLTGGAAGQAWYWFRVLCFFQFVCIGWVFFRADTVAQSFAILGAIATDLSPAPGAADMARSLIGFTWPLLLVQLLQWKWGDLNVAVRLPLPAKAALAACLLYLLCVHGTATDSFIYFQF
jgi:D-alanyl-lipoteichoic acid acyltransferase DltB (MBOAT superfamily)